MTETDPPSSQESNLQLRLRRYDSWSIKATDYVDANDFDTAFILYWIAFNTLYSSHQTVRQGETERHQINRFLQQICSLDQNQSLYNTVWHNYPGSIRNLLSNQYIFLQYWEDPTAATESPEWKASLDRERSQIEKLLKNPNKVFPILDKVFSRLYVLRNQLMHGAATHGGSINREQVDLSLRFIHCTLPVIAEIFRANPNENWGVPLYPPQI